MVEMTGFEPAASWSQTMRATNCATSRCAISFLDCHTIIAKGFVFVNSKFYFFENIFLQIKAPNISFCVIEILGG